ncbi:transposase [Streptomyces sp. NPDC051014]|uniref:IS110 family transposase n=1 Tax=Streptomyces sp. NPDC051014 TaxID=3155751 RepID=UPI0033E1E8B6
MPQSALPAQRVPDPAEEVVLGVDTHKDVHVPAVITTLGASLAHQEFPTSAARYRQLLIWARSFGVFHRAGVECTGSYGTALTRYLCRTGIEVVEIQPARPCHPAQARQNGCRRRGRNRSSCAVRTRHHRAEDSGRPCSGHAGPAAGQRIGRQGPYSGAEPAQGPTCWPSTRTCANCSPA